MVRATRSTPKSNNSTPKKTQRVLHTPKRSPRIPKNKRSKYFELPTDDDEVSSFDQKSEPSDSDSLPAETEDDEPPKKKSKSTPQVIIKATPKKTIATKVVSKKRKSNEESDEEPWETFIPKEDTPDAGDILYTSTMIHPNTLHFLKGIILRMKLI